MKEKNLVIFMPSIESGGNEKNFFIITNYLSQKISNLYVITADKSHKKKFNSNINLIVPKSNFWSGAGRLKKYLICLFLLLKLNTKVKKFLILTFQANIYCIILSKILGKKIIVRSNSSSIGWAKSSFKSLIFKIFLNLANLIIVNSYDLKKDFYNRFKINSSCIYNPLNKKEILKKSEIKINNRLFRNKKSLKIINIGSFINQKDQITLLKSINLIKNKIPIELILIGRGPNKEMIINYIKENDLSKNVKILGFQSNPYKFIKKSDLFVLSSIFEGLPNVLLEAQCLKKFIISSNCPTGPREILLNGKAGFLFKMKDESDLSKKILKYFNERKVLSKKIKIGYQNLDRFDSKINLDKYFTSIMKFI